MAPLSLAQTPPTAAELLLLQNPNAETLSRQAFKLTLMEFMARRLARVTTESRRQGLFSRPTPVYYLAPDADQTVGDLPHYRLVADLLRDDGTGHGLALPDLVQQAARQLGAGLKKFRTDYVLPALAQRGLVEAYQTRTLWVIPTTRYRVTPLGQTVHSRLSESLAQAHTLPSLLDTDPGQAALLTVSLGSALFLADDLRPYFSRLSQAMREYPSPNDAGGDSDGGDDDGLTGPSTPEPGGLDLSLSGFEGGLDGDGGAALDLDAFDALDSGLDGFDSSFDSSFDSGGDSGGVDSGDSGGGDSGGSE